MDLHNFPGGHGARAAPVSACSPARGSDDRVERAERAARIRERFEALAGQDVLLRVDGLVAGYGATEILHAVDLRLGAGQWLCLVGPSGAGKSTLLHSIFGLTDIRAGRVDIGGRNVTRLGPNAKLRDAGIAYVLHDSSIFPDMSVEQNLWLAGYLRGGRDEAKDAGERAFDRFPSLAARRDEPARSLSCGERRLLEISRALVMRPRLLLVDEPSASLDSEIAALIFSALRDLRDQERLSIVTVETDAKRGLAAADIGCAMRAGAIIRVGTGAELREDPAVESLFLG
jgi:branched-chain amino acid transport system ATP-binding protein